MPCNGVRSVRGVGRGIFVSSLPPSSAFEQGGSLLNEAVPTNHANAAGASGGFGSDAAAAGPQAGFDPVLISLIRRSMPNLVAYDLAGVQPMNGPTGLIFAMRSRYENQSGTEALFDEANTAFSGQDSGFDNTNGMSNAAVGLGTTAQDPLTGGNPAALNDASPGTYNVGQGMRTD